MNDIKDQLSWEEFKKESAKYKKPLNTINDFNRLIAHTKNFFLIAGYGAFTQGYILIITKDFLPSFGMIEKNKIEELNFLIKIIKNYIEIKYNRKSIVFEHGMCACIGGLDRAHIHIMSISKDVGENIITKSINKVLFNRKAGIEYINYNNYKLENIHDINQIFDSLNKEDYKNSKNIEIIGKIFSIKDIQNLSFNKWPLITHNHILRGGHYVYFDSGYKSGSFLTIKNFQTQFGREVVFNIEIETNKSFELEVIKRKRNNKFMEVWKWQNCMFQKNIILTINHSRDVFSKMRDNYKKEYEKYEFEII